MTGVIGASVAWAGTLPAAAATGRTAAGEACAVATGPYQKQVEKLLKLRVDGSQSPQDCRVVQAFQRREGIKPANGYASRATLHMLTVAAARKNPNAGGRCPVRNRRVACVDLTRQLMWVQQGRKVVYATVPIRSGRPGLETRNGWHSVFRKKRHDISTLYDNAPMPHSQYFSRGQAIHGSLSNLFSGPGSAGCVNLRPGDAARLYKVLQIGDAVVVFGRKPR
ncbi:L,D-transpeptidase [Streptomyces sp. TRM66268-LWL]|uniref:L,D-transpeptidase n=1 Tax=Streptomyces polyasparticus TaxID=2767826 RepID=A0ABR7SUI5_9ACTN|nr:L,D-transpeptidase [Streptomyces polyasparticus]MBC9719150.1 L,D-transpeptidase [Streptomyces polyasparticus]